MSQHPASRIILVDPSERARDVLGKRLRAQGYVVDCAGDAATGADMALSAPPSVVVADLWMPSISGVQLCRLLRSEPATADVAIILAGDTDEPKNRFRAGRAGANAYVQKHRTGDLLRAIGQAVGPPKPEDPFFLQLAESSIDIRDRIARHLDDALFDAIIASEVRALATCGELDRLFDLFTQFLSQVTQYRWVGLWVLGTPDRFALHHSSLGGGVAEREAREALQLPDSSRPTVSIEDEDALCDPRCAPAIVRAVPFGNGNIAKIAFSPSRVSDAAASAKLISHIARELGGPLRMAMLVEESQRLASSDPLTGLMNRRSFTTSIHAEIERSRRYGHPLSLAVLDVDHFKRVNDRYGHGAGDRVLAALGGHLSGDALRRVDFAARWGGEEFVIAYVNTTEAGALVAAERLRASIASLVVVDEKGEALPVTASIGVSELRSGDSLERLVDRADRAMYDAKLAGRNRVLPTGPEQLSRASRPPRSVSSPHLHGLGAAKLAS